MKKLRELLVRRASVVLVLGVAILLLAGLFGVGLFKTLSDSNDNFFATGTSSETANNKISELFGSSQDNSSIVLFEAKDSKADVTTNGYVLESHTILSKLKTSSVTSYYGTKANQFISRDKHAMYAIVTVPGSKDEQYKSLTNFAESVRSDKFNVSVGGSLVGQHQTQEQAKNDLEMAELISLPILAVLLFWFFRSPVAAAIPLAMSLLTIAGGLAVARIVHQFFSIDTYTLNVITILGVGLCIDYSLLAVNRFRDELLAKRTPAEAALKTMQTAGRTIFFSALTVIICLLSLLLLPVGFMQSVSVGGAAAVLVAMLISTLLLPPSLSLLGGAINKRSLTRHTGESKGWSNLAHFVTRFPLVSLLLGIIVLAVFVWPVQQFTTKTFDWHVLPSNQSAYHVGQVLENNFDIKTPSIVILAQYGSKPSPEQLCQLAEAAMNVDGVDSVQGAYVPAKDSSGLIRDCRTVSAVLQRVATESPQTTVFIEQNAAQYIKNTYAIVNVVPRYDANDARTGTLIEHLKDASYGENVKISVGGRAARAQDTLTVYRTMTPYIIGIIAASMIVILSILLGSIILPLQAVFINSMSLFISLGVLIMVFQFGWGANLLQMNTTGGFELSIPILIFVIAFGLSMDYSVFLYSRMHEAHDLTHDPKKAIIDGVTKTGPIITAAALLLFVVVASFATSRIAIIQQIGLGLAVAVLVDAFFVRIIFVPAVMKLFGRVSWWAPKWLKRLTITHT